MRELIEDLLTYARVASRARPLQPERLDDILDEVLFSLKVRLEEQGAVVERGCLPTVMADRRQLAQLMQNLISNAMKFQAKGAKPVVHISSELQDGGWLVRVKDNGIGIEQDYQEKIFVIFQRLHARDEYEGTGVGLAVCKKIVERHGGSIWVESQPNQGATFLFTLPDVQTSSSQIPLAVNELSCHDSQSDLTG